MKGLARYLNSVAFFCLIGLHAMLVNTVEAQGTILTANQLLAQKVDELNRFVGVVEADSSNCDALDGCSEDTCSRLECYQYGTPGDPNYQCLGVQNNTVCGSSCVERNFDFSKSFLRRVDQVDEHIARTVCTYRDLDESFKTSSIADSSHFFRVYFGAVDGTLRIYPGADEDCDVAPYDPRVRPWYVVSTSVPKVVTVLIDSGLNMRSKLSGGTDDETYGSKAIATALALLDTLQEGQDYVTLMSFDGDGIKPLNATMIYNSTLMYQSFSDGLTSNVNTGSQMDTNATATTDSINTAITELTSSSSIPANYLKVVIVLTTGEQFQNLSQINISSNSGVNLFVYNFLTTAAQCNPAIRASFEDIPPERIDNPLYALQSYYSFLANVHKSFMGGQVDYGQQYPDFSGIDNSTLTISKAAFGLSGELLGVLGIDFFEKKVDEQYPTIQFQAIVDAAGSHQPQTVFDTSKDLNTSVCFNHTDPCPGLDTTSTYVQGFLCQPKSDDKKIGCCGNCISKKNKLPIILGSAFGGLGVLLVIIYCCFVRSRNARKTKGRKVLGGSYPPPDSEAGLKAPGNVVRSKN